ncbi:MAG: ABC transporter permease [Dehalococcoidia bacterium]
MRWLEQWYELTMLQLRTLRMEALFISIINVAFVFGFVLGVGYIAGGAISQTTALYLTTGAATNSVVFIGLVSLPQILATAKYHGRLDFMRTLPVSREAYLLAQATAVGIIGLPSIVFAIVVGWWRYGLDLHPDPRLALVIPLAALAFAGVGAAIGILVPRMQLANAIAQLMIFYVVFFAPVMLPKEQLPDVLQFTARLLPPSYAADGLRATLTDLPGTNLGLSLGALAGFAVASMTAASLALRRRG